MKRVALTLLLIWITVISVLSHVQQSISWTKPDYEKLFDSMSYRGFDPDEFHGLTLLYWDKTTNKAVLSYADTTNKKRWLYGLINQDGDTLSPAVWPMIKRFSSGVAVVLTAVDNTVIEFSGYRHFGLYNDGLSGVIDTDGKIVIPFIYTYIDAFFDSAAIFSTHPFLHKVYNSQPEKIPYAKLGIMNSQGEILVPEIYDQIHISDFESFEQITYYIVKQKRLWGAIDKYGNTLVPIQHRKYETAYIALAELMRIDFSGR